MPWLRDKRPELMLCTEDADDGLEPTSTGLKRCRSNGREIVFQYGLFYILYGTCGRRQACRTAIRLSGHTGMRPIHAPRSAGNHDMRRLRKTRIHFTRWLRFVVLAAGLMGLLAGCALASRFESLAGHGHSHEGEGAHTHESDVYVGDVDATPADAVEGPTSWKPSLHSWRRLQRNTTPQPALRKWLCTTTARRSP